MPSPLLSFSLSLSLSLSLHRILMPVLSDGSAFEHDLLRLLLVIKEREREKKKGSW
jgi:hypothetical protein